MGENSTISWTDHTFNPWIGCTKVSPACDGCYAENLMDTRYHRVTWGQRKTETTEPSVGARVRTSKANWRKPIAWNKAAEAAGTRPRVFCASLADVFDNQVPAEWREDLFELIRITPSLTWLLLTKRPQNIVKMVKGSGAIAGNGTRYLPGNVALGTTIEDQVRVDLNAPALVYAKEQCGPAYTFISYEPALGPIDLWPWLTGKYAIDSVIAGGETDQGKHKARVSHPGWFRTVRDQCAAAGKVFHFKQWGEWREPIGAETYDTSKGRAGNPPAFIVSYDGTVHCFGRLGDDDRPVMIRVGKAKAGRLLDGVEHNAMLEVTR